MRFLKADLGRALREPAFWCCALLALGAGLAPWFRAGSWLAGHDGLLPFCCPALSALPYAAMGLRERACGMDRSIKLALGRRSYRLGRLCTCAATGALVMALPTAVLSLLDSPKWDAAVLGIACGGAFAALSCGLGQHSSRAYIPLLGPQVLALLLTYAAPHLDAPALWPPLWFSPYTQPGWGSAASSRAALGCIFALALALTALPGKEDRP